MSRVTILLSAVLLVACSEQAVPARPPAQRVAEKLPSELPDGWWLDAPLKAERIANCHPGNIWSEKLYWHRQSIIVKLHVLLERGHQTVGVIPAADSSPLVREVSEHARSCVERTRFVAPPQYPYEFEVTVNLKPARGAT